MIIGDKNDMTMVEINDMFREVERFRRYYYNLEKELGDKITRINQLEKELEKYKSMCYNLKKNIDSYEDTEEHEESYTDEEEHYKPGDTIIFKRLCEIGRVNGAGLGFASMNEYMRHVKGMMESNIFIVEIPEPDIMEHPYLSVSIDNTFGHVISVDKETITVKTLPEQFMPDAGQIILNTMTKKEIEDHIRIAHRVNINNPIYKNMLPSVTKVISCYMVDIRYESAEKQIITNDSDVLEHCSKETRFCGRIIQEGSVDKLNDENEVEE